mmetsp:Transcript_33456/g.38112  ORF Transcript_33456/g.38112 Transcript_33456/m.38112 type:complete len:117 (+) Transcript_33456:1764-2114(+)
MCANFTKSWSISKKFFFHEITPAISKLDQSKEIRFHVVKLFRSPSFELPFLPPNSYSEICFVPLNNSQKVSPEHPYESQREGYQNNSVNMRSSSDRNLSTQILFISYQFSFCNRMK